MEEEKRAKGRGSSEKRYFNLLWLLFSSIQRDNRYIAMINREIDFVLRGLTRRRERQRPSRVDCSQSEQKREIAFLIACIHARLARHSVWANRCQRPILPFSVFLPAKSVLRNRETFISFGGGTRAADTLITISQITLFDRREIGCIFRTSPSSLVRRFYSNRARNFDRLEISWHVLLKIESFLHDLEIFGA